MENLENFAVLFLALIGLLKAVEWGLTALTWALVRAARVLEQRRPAGE